MATAAVRRGTTYVLNGTKTYITNAPVAQTVLLIARSGSAAGHGELTAFLLDTTSPGCTVGGDGRVRADRGPARIAAA